MSQANEADVIRLINRFANSFDTKRWADMEACLSDQVDTDYFDLRGTPPEVLARDRFVELRQIALQPLRTHHLFSNHDVDIQGEVGTAAVSAVIFRKTEEGQTLHTHCLYHFTLKRQSGSWAISGIKQKVFWSDGNTQIHAGITKP